MGKKANERRKKLFAELQAQGKLDRPVLPRQMKSRVINFAVQAQAAPELVPEPEVVEFQCCLTKYGNAIPNGFRMCRGCLGP